MEALRRILDGLFPPPGHAGPDWQKLACALAARSAFSIITGGPGTGKTTTVVRLLALLQALALAEPPPGQRAPTPAHPPGRPHRQGRRAPERIHRRRGRRPAAGRTRRTREAVRAAIPVTVTTLHRLLGSRPDTRRLRHHAGNPLALDVLVIDEASMVDLEMMAAVLDALPPDRAPHPARRQGPARLGRGRRGARRALSARAARVTTPRQPATGSSAATGEHDRPGPDRSGRHPARSGRRHAAPQPPLRRGQRHRSTRRGGERRRSRRGP